MTDEKKQDSPRPFEMPPKGEPLFKDYIGKFWVISQTYDPHEFYIGFVENITKERITLNPFKGFKYDKEKKVNLTSLIKRDYYIEYDSRSKLKYQSVEKSTIERWCAHENEEILKELKYKNLGLIRRIFKKIF